MRLCANIQTSPYTQVSTLHEMRDEKSETFNFKIFVTLLKLQQKLIMSANI